jgi:hypothetical protein
MIADARTNVKSVRLISTYYNRISGVFVLNKRIFFKIMLLWGNETVLLLQRDFLLLKLILETRNADI